MHLVESESELRQIGQLTLEMQNAKEKKGKKRKERKREPKKSESEERESKRLKKNCWDKLTGKAEMRKKVRVNRATEKEGKKKYWDRLTGNAELHLGNALASYGEKALPCVPDSRGWVYQIQLFPTRKWGEDGVGGWIGLNILWKEMGERK